MTTTQRDPHDIAIATESTLIEILAELKRLNSRPAESRSSVEIKTSTRGVDISAKAYDGSDVEAQVGPAVTAYFAAMAQVQAQLNGNGKA